MFKRSLASCRSSSLSPRSITFCTFSRITSVTSWICKRTLESRKRNSATVIEYLAMKYRFLSMNENSRCDDFRNASATTKDGFTCPFFHLFSANSTPARMCWDDWKERIKTSNTRSWIRVNIHRKESNESNAVIRLTWTTYFRPDRCRVPTATPETIQTGSNLPPCDDVFDFHATVLWHASALATTTYFFVLGRRLYVLPGQIPFARCRHFPV